MNVEFIWMNWGDRFKSTGHEERHKTLKKPEYAYKNPSYIMSGGTDGSWILNRNLITY